MGSTITRQQAIERIKQNVAMQRTQVGAAFARFNERFTEDPVNAFAWADKTVMAAARKREAEVVAYMLDKVESGDLDLSALVAAIAEHLGNDLPVQMSGSTSLMSNVMDRAKSVVAAGWVQHRSYGCLGALVRAHVAQTANAAC